MAHVHTGRAEEGVALLERAASEGVGQGVRLWIELLELWLADAYRILGQPEGAEKHGLRALETAGERQARGVEAWTLRALGLVVARKDRAAGEQRLREAATLAQALGMRPLEAWCPRRGRAPLRRGRDQRLVTRVNRRQSAGSVRSTL